MFYNESHMVRYSPLQGIFTSLLIYLFLSKALRIVRTSIFPQKGVPIKTDVHSRPLVNIFFGVLNKGAFLPSPSHGIP